MASVGIHPPKTPVTSGSSGVARATLPNVCKMPGPPAPFVPTALPNAAQSGTSPKGYSKTVTIEGKPVAIRGASFGSKGDAASKGTGGGLLSANTHGPAKFITPGSLTVKADGKGIHLLGEPVLNNCGPSGSPPNTGATMGGVDQAKSKKDKCPHDALKTVERRYDDMIAEAQAEVAKAQDAEAAALKEMSEAAAALSNPPKGARMSALRQMAKQTEDRYEKARSRTRGPLQRLASAEREKKVAEDCGGGKNYLVLCKLCGDEQTDFDVVTGDGRVKEVKSSEGGFRQDQFEKQKKLVESVKLLGDGMTMKIAVPPGAGGALGASHPELLEGKIQEH